MNRNALRQKIMATHQRLDQRHEKIILASQKLTSGLQKLNPFLLIGIGLLAGLATGKIGWRMAFSGLNPFIMRYVSGLIDAKNDK